MEQLQELLNLLSKTPEMALWGASIYFLFILLKAASWITACTVTARLLIVRFFDWKDKAAKAAVDLETTKLEQQRIAMQLKVVEMEKEKVRYNPGPLQTILQKETYDGGHSLHKLMLAIGEGKAVHSHEIDAVTQLVLGAKSKKG